MEGRESERGVMWSGNDFDGGRVRNGPLIRNRPLAFPFFPQTQVCIFCTKRDAAAAAGG